jgi:hypothetical protein
MSSEFGYHHVPVLAQSNFLEWKTALEEYLTPHDHVRVIRWTKSSTGALVDPLPPSDPDELERWNQSERVAKGVIMMTAADHHLELVYKYKSESVWELWKAIEARHAPRDAFLYHQAWVHLVSLRKGPSESYVDYCGRVDDARSQIDRTTPAFLTPEQLLDQLLLFTMLNALPRDDPLRSLIYQSNINLEDVKTAFLQADTFARVAAKIGSTNAASVHPGHLVKDSPQLETSDRLIAHHVSVSAGKRGRQRKGQRHMQK